MLNCRLPVLTLLSAVVFTVVLVPELYLPNITTEAQRPGSTINANNPTNPFGGSYESPPQIVMVYNNTEYLGMLDSYSFRVAETLEEIPFFNDTIISTIPNQTIVVENGSVIRFEIKGNAPPEAQSDALAVNAYTIEGKPVKVLKVADESDRTSFIVDLEPDKEYILMVIATWLPQQAIEKISGYVAYSYRINLIGAR
jgi:hypothetical protein